MTERELAELLRGNPDISFDDGGISTGITGEISGHPYALPKLTEHQLQAEIVAECDRRSILRVEYSLIFAIPNGQYRQGQRMEPGLRAGIPDLFIPVARRGYHGLFIELKCGSNKPSQAQLDWARSLKAEGYRCIVVWDSVDAAIAEIESYLER